MNNNSNNISSKNELNYKSLNNTGNNHINITHEDKSFVANKKYKQYIKPLMLLLQKAEQILSIINLPKSSLDKYNTLKEISFKKCGLEYTPLVKNTELVKNSINNNSNNSINNIELDEKHLINDFSIIKNKLFDIILTYIETNFNSNVISNDFVANCEKLKKEMNDLFNIKYKNISNNLLILEKEKFMNYISRAQQNLISIYNQKEKKYNEIKQTCLLCEQKIDFLNNYINEIDELISPIYSKYNSDNQLQPNNLFDPKKIIDNHQLKTYTKTHFLLNFMNQLFTDNKNLLEALDEADKKKNEAYATLQMKNVKKVIEKNECLKNIEKLVKELNKNESENNYNENINKMDFENLVNEGEELINDMKEIINDDMKINDDITNKNAIIEQNKFLEQLKNSVQSIIDNIDIIDTDNNNNKINTSDNNSIINNSKISNNSNIISNKIINNKNINNNINSINNNINSINNTINSEIISNKDENENSKIKKIPMPFSVYKKKTNHISGGNVIINTFNNGSFNKDFFNTVSNFGAKNMNNNFEEDENKNEIKDKNNISFGIINQEQIQLTEDIDVNNMREMDKIVTKENENKENKDEGLEELRNMVLEEFKSRINDEKN